MAGVGLPGLVEQLQAEGGGRQGQAEADQHGRLPGRRREKKRSPASTRPDSITWARPTPKIWRRIAHSRLDLQFQPDDEQQEDDAEFADMQDLLAIGDQPEDRPEQDSGKEIAENGAEADPLEQRGRDDAAAQKQHHFEKNGGRRVFQFAPSAPISVIC